MTPLFIHILVMPDDIQHITEFSSERLSKVSHRLVIYTPGQSASECDLIFRKHGTCP